MRLSKEQKSEQQQKRVKQMMAINLPRPLQDENPTKIILVMHKARSWELCWVDKARKCAQIVSWVTNSSSLTCWSLGWQPAEKWGNKGACSKDWRKAASQTLLVLPSLLKKNRMGKKRERQDIIDGFRMSHGKAAKDVQPLQPTVSLQEAQMHWGQHYNSQAIGCSTAQLQSFKRLAVVL